MAIAQAGTYWLQVTAANGCVARDTVAVDLLVHSSASLAGALRLSAFPNPFSGKVQVCLQLPTAATLHWRLLDAVGHCVRTGTETAIHGEYRFTVEGGLAAGYYLLEVQTDAAKGVVQLMAQ